MGLLLSLAFALQLFTILTACAAPTPTAPPPSTPSWRWEWASGKGGGTSEQFARDRYACLQDYRQTASPFIQRDVVTELKIMTLHQEICLEGKGWKQVQDGTPKTPTNTITYWTASGYQTSPAGTRMEIQWIGHPPEPSGTQFQPDREACKRQAGMSLPLSNPPPFTTQQGEAVAACLLGKGWARLPVPRLMQAPLTEQEEFEFRARLEKERASSPPANP
jgi:hypothetical protein